MVVSSHLEMKNKCLAFQAAGGGVVYASCSRGGSIAVSFVLSNITGNHAIAIDEVRALRGLAGLRSTSMEPCDHVHTGGRIGRLDMC